MKKKKFSLTVSHETHPHVAALYEQCPPGKGEFRGEFQRRLLDAAEEVLSRDVSLRDVLNAINDVKQQLRQRTFSNVLPVLNDEEDTELLQNLMSVAK